MRTAWLTSPGRNLHLSPVERHRYSGLVGVRAHGRQAAGQSTAGRRWKNPATNPRNEGDRIMRMRTRLGFLAAGLLLATVGLAATAPMAQAKPMPSGDIG